LVSRPRDAFVASFTGANVLRGRVVGREDGLSRVRLGTGEEVFSTDELGGEVVVVVYPWEISVGRTHADDSALNVIQGEVRSVVIVGNRARVTIGPLTAEITGLSAAKLELVTGAPAYASFKATGTKLIQV
jgi:molybdate transport system ATP-binding protein